MKILVAHDERDIADAIGIILKFNNFVGFKNFVLYAVLIILLIILK